MPKNMVRQAIDFLCELIKYPIPISTAMPSVAREMVRSKSINSFFIA